MLALDRPRSLLFPSTLLALLATAAHGGECDEGVGVVPFGEPTLGSNGPPELRGVGAPVVDTPFATRILSGRASGFGVLLVSPNEEALFVANYQGTLQLGLPFVVQQPFLLTEDGESPELLSVPAMPPALCGLPFVAQAFLVDPAATGGIAFTNALRITPGVIRGPLFPNRTWDAGGMASGVVLTGDLNLDGILDAITIQRESNDAAVFLGTGFGDVAAPTTLDFGPPAGPILSAPAAVLDHVDGDAYPDLLVVQRWLEELWFLPGLGDGSFGLPVVTSLGRTPTGLAVGRLDEDDVLDAVVTNGGDDTATVLLGAGDGSFAAVQTLLTGAEPTDPELADLDADGALDLVVACPPDDLVRVYLRAESGVFEAGATLQEIPLTYPATVEVGDYDGDGDQDVAVGYAFATNDESVSMWAGDGAGGFQSATGALENLAFGLWAIHDGDVDGDGVPEVLATPKEIVNNGPGPWLVSGLGSEAPPEPVLLGLSGLLTDIEVVDFDGDGLADLVMADGKHGRLTVVLAVEPGTFAPVVPGGPGAPQALRSDYADMNGDGVLDLIGHSPHVGPLYVAPGLGDGTFGEPVVAEAAELPRSLTVGEFSGDDLLDVALTFAEPFPEPDVLHVYAGQGDGSVSSTPIVQTLNALPEPGSSRFDDLDGDGDLDLYVGTEMFDLTMVYLGDGAGAFALSAGYDGTDARAGDVTSDGIVDLVTQVEDGLLVHAGLGDGTFGPEPITLPVIDSYYLLHLADVDADGLLDIVAIRSAQTVDAELVVTRNLGDGLFAPPVVAHEFQHSAWSLEFGDWNADGDLDLVVFDGKLGRLRLLPGHGDGTWGPAVNHSIVSFSVTRIVSADFDNDGVEDLAPSSSVLLNRILHGPPDRP